MALSSLSVFGVLGRWRGIRKKIITIRMQMMLFSGQDNGSWPILFTKLFMFLHFIKVFTSASYCFISTIILAVHFLASLHNPVPSSLQLFVEPTNKSSLWPFCLPGNNGNACTLYEGSRMHRQSVHILPPLSQDYSENGKFCKTEIRILLDTKSWQIKFI